MNDGFTKLYAEYSKLKDLLRTDFPLIGAESIKLYSPDGWFPSAQEELNSLSNIFTCYFTMGPYRGLLQMVRLACFIHLEAIVIRKRELSRQLGLNTLGIKQKLHHDEEFTHLIVSQFPFTQSMDFSFGGKRFGNDLIVRDTVIELGDCEVVKIENELLGDPIKFWVIPIYRHGKIKTINYFYEFTRDRNWDIVEEWGDKERFDNTVWMKREFAEKIFKSGT